MKAIDYKLTDTREGAVSDSERRDALLAANEVIRIGGSVEDAECVAYDAAFDAWARKPESAELVIDITRAKALLGAV